MGQAGTGPGGTCAECKAGQYRSSLMATQSKYDLKCEFCEAGKYQNEDGATKCGKCDSGRFSDVPGALACEPCDPSTYFHLKGRDSRCLNCPLGWTSGSASTKCLQCGAGQFSNTLEDGCIQCVAGQYRTGDMDNATKCVQCDSGQYQSVPGTTYCLQCDAGFYESETASQSCKSCQPGLVQDGKGKTSCKKCEDPNKAANTKQTECVVPPLDPTLPKILLQVIVPASTGELAARRRRSRLLAAGEDTVADGFAAKLTARIVRSSVVPPTSAILEVGDQLEVHASKRTDFSGSTIHVLDQTNFDVVAIEKDAIVVSILVSAITNTDTDIEEQEISGDTIWHTQLYFKIRVLKNGQKGGAFSIRNDAWETANKCSDTEYLSTFDGDGISDDGTKSNVPPRTLFRSDTATTGADATTTPTCLPCPDGGNCVGKRTFVEVNNLAGYQQLSWDSRAFGKCPYPSACPQGILIPSLHNTTIEDGSQKETACYEGHTGDLCAQCISGWTLPIGENQTTCVECPEQDANIATLSGLVFLGALVVAFLVYDSLDGIKLIIDAVEKEKAATTEEEARIANSQTQIPFHSVGIRIVSSYLQVAGLLANFQLTLPPAVESLAVAEAGASGIGGQVIAFSCLYPSVRGPELFFLKQIMTTIVVPLFIGLAVVIFWGTYGMLCAGSSKKKKKKKSAVKVVAVVGSPGQDEKKTLALATPTSTPPPTSKKTIHKPIRVIDKLQGSLVVLYYLMFPSILNSITSMLQCTSYGIDKRESTSENYLVQPKVLLDAELSIVCYQPKHLAMVMSVALPGGLVFVVILPLIILFAMRRHARRKELYARNENFNPAVSYRYGFLFLGYEDNMYAWELLVMMRKAAFVVTAGILRGSGPIAQVTGAVCILMIAVSLHLQFRPYEIHG